MIGVVRTTEQRIDRIRQRLVNDLSGFQSGDVQALLDDHARLAAELAALVVRVERARTRCERRTDANPLAPTGRFAQLIIGDLDARTKTDG